MDKIVALEEIKRIWDDEEIGLGKKIMDISSLFSSEGLDLESTAAFIKATPAELEAFLTLGELDDEIIDMISEIDPPQTTWSILASANEEEVLQALNALRDNKNKASDKKVHFVPSEFVYQQMLEVSGPTKEQKIQSLSGFTLSHALKKGKDFKALTDWETKFMNSVSNQKIRGKTLTEKQLDHVIVILNKLADVGAITRNSIDGDQKDCDMILDALGR